MTHNLMSQAAVTHAISHGSLPHLSVSDHCMALFLTMPLARCRLIHRVGAKPQRTYALREQGGRLVQAADSVGRVTFDISLSVMVRKLSVTAHADRTLSSVTLSSTR
jgi:hypothetical protein